MRELLSRYNELESQILNYFGYQQEWTMLPLDDMTMMYWMLADDKVVWSDKLLTAETVEKGMEIYDAVAYIAFNMTERWIWTKDDYTLLRVNTRSDNNHLLMVFDNSRQVTDRELIKLYKECWW